MYGSVTMVTILLRTMVTVANSVRRFLNSSGVYGLFRRGVVNLGPVDDKRIELFAVLFLKYS